LALVNPLKRARFRVGRSLRTARDGTTRTVGWVKDGVVSAPGKARAKLRSDSTGDSDPAPASPTPTAAATAAPASSEPSGSFGRTLKAIRENPRVAIAWAAVAVLVLAWIGWTVYVWIENGSTAGVGVLVSWPAAIAALALVVSPFVAATFLIRRLSGEGGPQMAGAAGIAGDSSGGTATVTAGTDEKDAAGETDESADEDDTADPEAEPDAGDEKDEDPDASAEDDSASDADDSDDDSDDADPDSESDDDSGPSDEKDEAAV
jgi:hypothetical protein